MRDFTGRTADLAALDALLPVDQVDDGAGPRRLDTVVITAIDGTAGIGKTALAIYWAHHVRARFPDGTLYANLRGYGPSAPAAPGEVLEGFLRALGVAPAQIPVRLEEQEATYRSVLDGRRVLIVLDNVNAPEQVRPLLPGSAGCFVVVTSRSGLSGLMISHGAAHISLDLLPIEEAIELLRGIVGSARSHAEPLALIDMAYACARLPLALRIAGQRAASRPRLSLADVQSELAQERDRLEVLSASGDEATTVRAVFNWSYNVLRGDIALVFRRLGLQPGTEITAHAVAALTDTSLSRARLALDTLAEAHLIEPIASGRYQIHDLLRVYALERAEAEDALDERRRAVQRLLEFYLHAADTVDRRLIVRARHSGNGIQITRPRYPMAFDTDRQVADWFRTERATLVAAIRLAADSHHYLLAWQISETIYGLFDRDGNRFDWLRTLRLGLECARELDDRFGEALMLSELGNVLTQVRQYDEAIERHTEALRLAEAHSDPAWKAGVLEDLGSAYHGALLFDEAITCYTQSLDIRRAQDDSPWREAIVLNSLGDVYTDIGRFEDAVELHERALHTFSAQHDRSREGWSLRLLADAYQAQGRLQDAAAGYQHALKVLESISYTQEQARASAGLGDCLHKDGDDTKASVYWQQAHALFRSIGDPQADEVNAHLAESKQ